MRIGSAFSGKPAALRITEPIWAWLTASHLVVRYFQNGNTMNVLLYLWHVSVLYQNGCISILEGGVEHL